MVSLYKYYFYSFVDREEFQMGSLSHYINARAHGYQDLPAFPETPSDPSVRNVPTEPSPKMVKKMTTGSKKKSFYSDSDNSSPVEGKYYGALSVSNNQFIYILLLKIRRKVTKRVKRNQVKRILTIQKAKIVTSQTTVKQNRR